MSKKFILTLLIVCGASVATSQTPPPTPGLGMDGSQSYSSFGADSVNLSSLNLTIHPSLLDYKQRGTLPDIQLKLTSNTPQWFIDCVPITAGLKCFPGPTYMAGVLPSISTDLAVYNLDPNAGDPTFPPAWGLTETDGAAHALIPINIQDPSTANELRAVDGSGSKVTATQGVIGTI